MRFALIYRTPFTRTQSKKIDGESRESLVVDLSPKDFLVEHLVDFETREITPVVLRDDGTLLEVPDGPYGEATPAEYFENMEVEA